MSSTFADLGVSEAVAGALRRRAASRPRSPSSRWSSPTCSTATTCSSSRRPARARRSRSACRWPTASTRDGAWPSALILAPTRELAAQIVDELAGVMHARGLQITAVYGGVGIHNQAKQAAPRARARRDARPAARPDRARRRARSTQIELLVLDEADRMLDMGFKPVVDRIVAHDAATTARRCSSPRRSRARSGRIAAAYTHDAAPPRAHAGAREGRPHRAPLPPRRARGQGLARSCTSWATRSAGSRSSSCAPSAAPTGSSSGSARTTCRPSRCTATSRSPSARRRSPASSRARSTRSSPPTWPRAGSTSRGITHVINYDAPGGARGLRPPDRPHRARRRERRRHHVRARRPGARRGQVRGRAGARARPRRRRRRRRAARRGRRGAAGDPTARAGGRAAAVAAGGRRPRHRRGAPGSAGRVRRGPGRRRRAIAWRQRLRVTATVDRRRTACSCAVGRRSAPRARRADARADRDRRAAWPCRFGVLRLAASAARPAPRGSLTPSRPSGPRAATRTRKRPRDGGVQLRSCPPRPSCRSRASTSPARPADADLHRRALREREAQRRAAARPEPAQRRRSRSAAARARSARSAAPRGSTRRARCGGRARRGSRVVSWW